MKKVIVAVMTVIALLYACSDTIQETIYDKDLETGKFDHSRFEYAKFK